MFVIAYAANGIGGINTIYEITPSGVMSTFANAASELSGLVVQVPEPSVLGLLAVGACRAGDYRTTGQRHGVGLRSMAGRGSLRVGADGRDWNGWEMQR